MREASSHWSSSHGHLSQRRRRYWLTIRIPSTRRRGYRISCQKPSDVTVRIYATDGSVVRTLALGHQDAGMYHNRSQAAYWDGRNAFGETVASGVYFYTLTAGEFTATRKMLILK